ncbi:MAG: mechanosensitive ion channel family protein [Desulfurococcaceae archaeon]
MISEARDIVQGVLWKLQVPFIIILTLIAVRVLLKRVLDTLNTKKILSFEAKETIIRVLDIFIIIIAFLMLLSQFIEVYSVLIAVGVLGLSIAVILFDRIKGFIVYLRLQADRRVLNKPYMIILPGFGKSIYGRVTNISSTYCTIEDIFGDRYMVPNTLIYNAVLKPYTPYLVFRLRVKLSSEEDKKQVLELIKNLRSDVFRVDERKCIVDRISKDEVDLKIALHPLSTTIRSADIQNFIAEQLERFKEYEVEIELIEIY